MISNVNQNKPQRSIAQKIAIYIPYISNFFINASMVNAQSSSYSYSKEKSNIDDKEKLSFSQKAKIDKGSNSIAKNEQGNLFHSNVDIINKSSIREDLFYSKATGIRRFTNQDITEYVKQNLFENLNLDIRTEFVNHMMRYKKKYFHNEITDNVLQDVFKELCLATKDAKIISGVSKQFQKARNLNPRIFDFVMSQKNFIIVFSNQDFKFNELKNSNVIIAARGLPIQVNKLLLTTLQFSNNKMYDVELSLFSYHIIHELRHLMWMYISMELAGKISSEPYYPLSDKQEYEGIFMTEWDNLKKMVNLYDIEYGKIHINPEQKLLLENPAYILFKQKAQINSFFHIMYDDYYKQLEEGKTYDMQEENMIYPIKVHKNLNNGILKIELSKHVISFLFRSIISSIKNYSKENYLQEYDTFRTQYFSQEFNEYMFPKTTAYHDTIIQQYLDKKNSHNYDYNKYNDNYINKNINQINDMIQQTKYDEL